SASIWLASPCDCLRPVAISAGNSGTTEGATGGAGAPPCGVSACSPFVSGFASGPAAGPPPTGAEGGADWPCACGCASPFPAAALGAVTAFPAAFFECSAGPPCAAASALFLAWACEADGQLIRFEG